MSSCVNPIGDADFQTEVLDSDTPVLVDFWAPWCGPCRMISPIVDEIAQSFEGKLRVVKINVDENPETPRRYAVRGIPTLMIFKGGEIDATQVGAVSRSQLEQMVTRAVG